MRIPGKELAQSVLWAWLYVGLVAAPLLVAGLAPGGRGFEGELGSALGFLALSIFAGQFAMTARFKWLEPPLGTDLVYAFHRHVTWVGVAFALAHPVLSSGGLAGALSLSTPSAGFAAFSAVLALALVALVVGWSLVRRRLRLDYDRWRRAHGLLALAAVLLVGWHAVALGGTLSAPLPRALWLVWTAAWVLLLFRVRLVKPLQLLRRPYELLAATPQPGHCVELVLAPRGHRGFRFRSGQFAWITVGESPLAGHEHPFSISGSAAAAPQVAFTVKALGDFSRGLQSVRPGETVYVDGPFGTLSPERYPRAKGYGFVAGGVGIGPIIGALRTLAAKGDRRQHVLVYGAVSWDAIPHRDEIVALSRTLRLEVIWVLERPPADWTGARGLISDEVLAEAVAHGESEWFVCGPPPMMDAVERGLHRAGVALSRIHAERFDLV